MRDTQGTFNFLYLRTYGLALVLSVLVFSASAGAQSVSDHLTAIDQLLQEAREASTAAESAADIMSVKQQTDLVFAAVWGHPSGLTQDLGGAAHMHGWKTRWQTTGEEFDENHVERHGDTPPAVTDLAALGIMGRGRAVIATLLEQSDQPHMQHVIASLSNVIGWMRLDDGVTKGERQPRVDLTHMWDAPSRFWNTTADTGWLNEVFSQSINILKTDYGDDLSLAQSHAKAMTALIEQCRNGMDENGDGAIAPAMMEGGLDTALAHARYGGLIE